MREYTTGSAHARLATPAWSLPFGADASGRDVLARVGHGAVVTLGTTLVVVLICLVVGIAVGLFPLAPASALVLAAVLAVPLAGPDNKRPAACAGDGAGSGPNN